MAFGFAVEIKGNFALFSRPELKVERYTYDVITPSAARGILEAILWKPAIKYVIDEIHVLNPIKFTNIRRNEIAEKLPKQLARSAMCGNSKPLYISRTGDTVQQRASLLLKDVHYIIKAHFEMTDKAGERDAPEKFYSMILRRLRNGQCYHQPYFGCREFPVKFGLYEEKEFPSSYYSGTTRDLGIMLYDMDYSDRENIHPTFFHAVMKDGVIELADCEVLR